MSPRLAVTVRFRKKASPTMLTRCERVLLDNAPVTRRHDPPGESQDLRCIFKRQPESHTLHDGTHAALHVPWCRSRLESYLLAVILSPCAVRRFGRCSSDRGRCWRVGDTANSEECVFTCPCLCGSPYLSTWNTVCNLT